MAEAEDHIDAFFAQYPRFAYDPREESWAQYHCMVRTLQWQKGSHRERAARKRFNKAIVAQFGRLYGIDENKLQSLQLLCQKLGISPGAKTVTACKKALSKVHVNIMDFIDSERTGTPIRTFTSITAFRAYTKNHGKMFPKREAKDNSLLKYLLRPIFT